MNRGYKGKSFRVSASEIAQFHFCPMSWVLQRKGFVPASFHLEKGKLKHNKMGMNLKKTDHLMKRTYLVRFIGVSFIVLSISIWLLQVIL